MFGIKVTIEKYLDRVAAAVEKASFKNIGHALASIRKDAGASIKFVEDRRIASAPGTPPHTHSDRTLWNSLRYEVGKDKMSGVVGPTASRIGEAAAAHEFGGEYKGQSFTARPFMRPALERQADRFAGSWKGSVGE